jgi:hypothetical protein
VVVVPVLEVVAVTAAILPPQLLELAKVRPRKKKPNANAVKRQT